MTTPGAAGPLPFVRPAFWVYAAALFVATHWPNLAIESDIVERPDLFIHVGAFGLWAALLLLTGYLGPAHTVRAAALTFAFGAAFAALDEGTQAIPILGRTAVVDDYLANLAGVAAGCAGGLTLARALRRVRERRAANNPPA